MPNVPVGVTVTERFESRKYSETADGSMNEEYVFEVRGTDVEADVLTAIYATVPSYVASGGYAILPLAGLTRVKRGPKLFECVASYEVKFSKAAPPPVGTHRVSFDTTGAQTKITEAPAVANFGANAIDMFDFIGVSIDVEGKQQVSGVEITIPVYKWQEAWVLNFANFAALTSYAAILKGLTGAYNDDTFGGFAIGEVLFLGATGSGAVRNNPNGSFDMEITFHFAQSDNISSKTISGIAGVSALGWQYVWTCWQQNDTEDSAPTVIGVYVNEVYKGSKSFEGLVTGGFGPT